MMPGTKIEILNLPPGRFEVRKISDWHFQVLFIPADAEEPAA